MTLIPFKDFKEYTQFIKEQKNEYNRIRKATLKHYSKDPVWKGVIEALEHNSKILVSNRKKQQHPEAEKVVKDIGHDLNDIGGLELMQHFIQVLSPSLMRVTECAWHGIGDWEG